MCNELPIFGQQNSKDTSIKKYSFFLHIEKVKETYGLLEIKKKMKISVNDIEIPFC